MFKDRKHAAVILAKKLKQFRNAEGVVIAIPRGGVILGYEIAKALNLPLEIMLTQKIGHPFNKEYSIGSVSLFGSVIDNSKGVSKEYIDREIENAGVILRNRYALYMSGRKPVDLKGKTVIIVDDGIATGNTILSIIELLKQSNPEKIIIAVPVASRKAIELLQNNIDALIYVLMIPDNFYSVSQVYVKFEQVSDDEVIRLLNDANQRKEKLSLLKS